MNYEHFFYIGEVDAVVLYTNIPRNADRFGTRNKNEYIKCYRLRNVGCHGCTSLESLYGNLIETIGLERSRIVVHMYIVTKVPKLLNLQFPLSKKLYFSMCVFETTFTLSK